MPIGQGEPAFRPQPVREWEGRYGRIVGGSRWKIATVNGQWWPVIEWHTEDCSMDCEAETSTAAEQMAAAVVRGKQHLGGSGGGSFVINEFGQVIVPSSAGDGRRVVVGEITGSLRLHNPDPDLGNGDWIELWNDAGLSPGDSWPHPYVGVQYNLSGRSKIYYYRTGEEGGQSEFPDEQDDALVRAIRRIRRTGAARLLVNPYGIVLTKSPAGEWQSNEEWNPVYVGRINENRWFRKED